MNKNKNVLKKNNIMGSKFYIDIIPKHFARLIINCTPKAEFKPICKIVRQEKIYKLTLYI